MSEHFGLALKLARRRYRMYRVMPREDYEQEAMLSLVVAAEKFDAGRGAKFSTYAFRRIAGALINAERVWLGWNRKLGSAPVILPFVIGQDDPPFAGMVEAETEWVASSYEGQWFARPARLVLLSGLSTLEVSRLCNCEVNTVHQSVSYFRKHLLREFA